MKLEQLSRSSKPVGASPKGARRGDVGIRTVSSQSCLMVDIVSQHRLGFIEKHSRFFRTPASIDDLFQ
jgi:hypothetical protein